jgi:hypothetical protein
LIDACGDEGLSSLLLFNINSSKWIGDDDAIAISAGFDVIDGGMRTAGDKNRQIRFV